MIKRKIAIIVTLLIICLFIIPVGATSVFSKEIKKISRIKFKKVMKIKSEGNGYYLKLPIKIKIDKEGNIYILDGSRGGWSFYEILKFNKKGKFIKKLVHRGQGPGEAICITSFSLKNNRIYIYDSKLRKIIIKDSNGDLQKEYRIKMPNIMKREGLNFMSVHNNKYYFILTLIDFTTKNTSIINENKYFCIYRDEKWDIKKTNFPVSIFFIRGSNGVMGLIPVGSLHYAIYKGKYLFINNRAEYNIKLYDIENDEIVYEFMRKYKRVKNNVYNEKKQGGVMIAGRWYYKPHIKYYDDIQKLLIHGNKLWVITSMVNKNKGVLVDVFTDGGQYINKFYLKLSNKTDYNKMDDVPMVVSRNYLYTIERDKNDEPVIIKYKIKKSRDTDI